MRKFMDIINEVEVGGAVESGFLDDLKKKDYANDQLDLFPEIPTLDPKLPKKMKIVGKIDRYRMVEMKDGKGTRTFILFDAKTPIAWISINTPVEGRHDISHFLEHGTGGQVKSVYVDEGYRGQGLAPKIYLWILTHAVDYLVADEKQTYSGMKMWKRMLSSKLFDLEVFDREEYESRRRRPGNDYHQVYKTDGRLIPWVTLAGKADKLMSNE